MCSAGEDFISQRIDWQTCYTFSAKEKDKNTGYHYFGARYYDSEVSVWLSVDPLADKYPSMSPYIYTAGNPVMLVDPDGRTIWITGNDGANDVEYKQGMEYKGDDKLILKRIGVLNKMNETKNGKKVLTTLVDSENHYMIMTGDGENPEFCANDIESGQKGGQIETKGNEDLKTYSHELFHAYQDEKGQGGASIFNEVEANLFASSVQQQYNIKHLEPFGSFFSGSSLGGIEGKAWNDLVDSQFNKDEFNKREFNILVLNFKNRSIKNIDGHYNNYPIRRKNQTEYLISDFYPLRSY
mgnify:CR=1 FL=1